MAYLRYKKRLWQTNTMPMTVDEAGRKGGKARVAKGFAKMAPARRKQIARKAAQSRWRKYREGRMKSQRKPGD